MGFMEALVAFMSVMVVLTAYLGVVANVTVVALDPAESLDERRFTATVEDGVLVPGYLDYMGEFLDASGCSGIAVEARVPGGFCQPSDPVVLGSMDGSTSSRTIVITVSDDNGRTFPAVLEVTVCR